MNVVVLGNFGVTQATINPSFQNTGIWYEYYTGDVMDVTDAQALITLAPGEYRLYTTKQFEMPNIGVEDHFIAGTGYGNLKVYPNPVRQIVYIPEADNIVSISVYNVFGQEIYSSTHENKLNQIEVQSFTDGIYLIVATDKQGLKKTARIIKN